MNVRKTPFAQVMEFAPSKTSGGVIERHPGDTGVHTLGSSDLLRAMAFAQLTWRESLRDVEASRTANQAKQLCVGIRAAPA